MPVVKLINNENRSLNPFKGHFLLNFKIKTRNDTTKGKIEGKGNYLFNQYQTLIDLDDYLRDSLKEKVEKRHLDTIKQLKWGLDEELSQAYLYYKTFFLLPEHDAKLEEIWVDLKINAKKVDSFIETELNQVWVNFVREFQNQPVRAKESEERMVADFYKLFKELLVKPFFKDTIKLMSLWIQLVCVAKNIKYTVTSKNNPLGFKFDVFAEDTTKEVDPALTQAVVENTKELKERYIAYEKAQIKAKLSKAGAYTTLKQEDNDFLELYYDKPQDEDIKEKIIQKRKDAVVEPRVPNVAYIKENFKTDKDVDDKILRDKFEITTIRLQDQINNTSFSDYTATKIFNKMLKNKVVPTLASVVEYYLMEVANGVSISRALPVNIDFKPLLLKIKQSKIDSQQKLNAIFEQFFLSNGLDISSSPYKESLQGLQSLKFDSFTFLKNIVDTELASPRWDKSNYQALYDYTKRLKEAENPKTVVNGKTLAQEIKEAQVKQLKKANVIFSEKFGAIEGENGKSAYEVYQQKKFETELKTKTLRDAYPSVVGNKLVFKHLKKTPIYEQDATGQLVLDEDGKAKPAYEKNRDGSLKLDLAGNPIPMYKDISLSIPPIEVERMSDEMVDNLTGLEKEVELSDDTSVKADSPFRFAHLVRVKTTTINGITKDIITKGPFKGFSVEDLANATGKFLGEGQAYSVDTNGVAVSVQEIISTEDGDISINYNAINEPYITWAKGRFLIGMPTDRKYAAERNALKALKATRSSIEVVQGSGQSRWSYYFEGDDYEAIKQVLGSCLMSKKAYDELKKYYAKLLEKDRALSEENLLNYQPEKIGGFKDGVKFNNKQQEALAWLDSNDLKGVMALDTGVGKTLVGVTAMQIGSKKKPNAKFLIVSSDRLVGNFFGEIDNFLTPEVASELKGRNEEIGFSEFIKRWQNNYDFKGQYYCMIFDEVNEALTGKASEAISNVKHPRKILLTGSALEKSPADLFKFVSLSTGNPVDPAKEKAFLDKFAVNVGGKFVGIKPESKHLFNSWLKQNAYFANKMEVEYLAVGQAELKPLEKVSNKVNMEEEVADAYKDIAKDIQKELKQMQERYAYLLSGEDLATMSEDLQTEKDIAVGNLKNKIALLHLFSLNPTKAMKKYYKLNDKEFPEGKVFANPKIDEAIRLGLENVEGSTKRRTIYFTEDNDVAKETVIALSKKIKGVGHALCLTNYIIFYMDGKIVKKSKVTKKTNLERYVLNLRTANAQAQVAEDMSWAIKTVKKWIANNEDVATMTCNSSYSRGFNLQKFKSVVHLDRDGWDSEEIKQRTARAFRQGQEDVVQEVMIDAVLPPSLVNGDMAKSIDELRGMVQGADQKFFNTIIKESGAIKLAENYDKVEHADVSEKATQPNLQDFTRAIIPTRQVQDQIEEFEKNKRENPVKYTTLDPNRFNHPNAVNLTPEQKMAADLSGLSGILNVSYKGIKQQVNIYGGSRVDNLNASWLSHFTRNISTDSVENYHFKANNCAPDSLGNRALFSQLVAMKKEGKKFLQTHGVGDYTQFDPETGMSIENGYFGYWVWPKFGYNVKVDVKKILMESHAKLFQQALMDKIAITDNLPALQEPVKPVKPSVPGSLDVSKLKNIIYEPLPVMSRVGRIVNQMLGMPFIDKIQSVFGVSQMAGVIIGTFNFKKWDIAEELEYHNTNRLVLNYASKKQAEFPIGKGNLVSPASIPEGRGLYKAGRTEEYIKQTNKSYSEKESYQQAVTRWNNFVTPLLTNYPDVCNLFNLFKEQDNNLTDQQFEDFVASYEARLANQSSSLQTEMDEYNRQMVIYNEQYRLYEEEKKRQESILNVDAIAIDKKTIMDDLANNVYSASISSVLNREGWHYMRRLKACYILVRSGKITDDRMDIIDLYEIVHKGADGKVFKAGEEWWKVIGTHQYFKLNIEDENSKSYKKLTKYMMEKVKEAGYETLEEYLSSPVDPFDVKSYSCWYNFFHSNNFFNFSKEDKLSIVKTYIKELKKVIMDATDSKRNELLTLISLFETNTKTTVRLAQEEQPQGTKTSEYMMYQNALADDHILTAIDEQIANEETLEKTKEDISVLRGDLKAVSNPFKKSKGDK